MQLYTKLITFTSYAFSKAQPLAHIYSNPSACEYCQSNDDIITNRDSKTRLYRRNRLDFRPTGTYLGLSSLLSGFS